ncbi:MAG: MoaD/ThiS family protein [Methanobacteriota archaeon]|nr:MAG: MoaD/ThiS family protein [Euryarchaeota archaeon]
MRLRRRRRSHRPSRPWTHTSQGGPMVRIVVASPIAVATRGEREFEVDFQGTLRDLFDVVTTKYGSQFQQRILEADGALRRFVNVYVNGEDARFLAGLDTPIARDATVDLLPAISGG